MECFTYPWDVFSHVHLGDCWQTTVGKRRPLSEKRKLETWRVTGHTFCPVTVSTGQWSLLGETVCQRPHLKCVTTSWRSVSINSCQSQVRSVEKGPSLRNLSYRLFLLKGVPIGTVTRRPSETDSGWMFWSWICMFSHRTSKQSNSLLLSG